MLGRFIRFCRAWKKARRYGFGLRDAYLAAKSNSG